MVAVVQGLTVQLHPYQRQALQFMLDNERLERGNHVHFWYRFPEPLTAVLPSRPRILAAASDLLMPTMQTLHAHIPDSPVQMRGHPGVHRRACHLVRTFDHSCVLR